MAQSLTKLNGPAIWTGTDLDASSAWIYPLTDAMLAELNRALETVLRRGLDWREVRAENFHIPVTSALLDEVSSQLEQGLGLAKLTGLDVESYADAERRALFFGIGANLGTPISMSREGMMMNDVTDEGAEAAGRYGHVAGEDDDFLASRARVHSTAQLRFHNDRCDVVALMCVRAARSGGISRLASVPRIHNEMLQRRPDLLRVLFEDYHRSRLGEEFGDNAAWYALPVFAACDGHITAHYSRTFIEAAQLNDEVPKMRPQQWEAIELMAEIADEIVFESAQLPGEIQLLNNHVVFHARTAYEDYPEQKRRRLLHRLWISMPNSRPLPRSYEVLFRNVRAGAVRGGIPLAQPALAADVIPGAGGE